MYYLLFYIVKTRSESDDFHVWNLFVLIMAFLWLHVYHLNDYSKRLNHIVHLVVDVVL